MADYRQWREDPVVTIVQIGRTDWFGCGHDRTAAEVRDRLA